MNRMTRAVLAAAVAIAATAAGLAQAADESPKSRDEAVAAIQGLPWQSGPATAQVGSRSRMPIPDKIGYLAESSGSRFLELSGNLPSPGTSVLMGGRWWAAFDFDEMGYVKDDEKIDADALMKSMQESDGPANEERRKRGLAELHTDGWFVPPHYDPETKYLEWGVKLHASDHPDPVVNYSVRLLGRKGVENVVLVSSPETLDADVKELKGILRGFAFDSGEKYSEFKAGDHVAEIGLGALVLGGAAAVAAKTGFWKVLLGGLAAFWKVIALALAGAGAFIGKLFKRKQV